MKFKKVLVVLLIIINSLAWAVEEIKNKDGTVSFRLTPEEKAEILQEQMQQSAIIQTKTFTFDTATVEGCEQLKRFLIVSSLDKEEVNLTTKEQCYKKGEQRYLTVFLSGHVSDQNFIINGVGKKDLQSKVLLENLLPQDSIQRAMVVDTIKMVVVGAGVIGAISSLPEDVSNWSDDKTGYMKNIKKGFRMDKDNPWMNWGLHPYLAGAQYFFIARHNGLSKWKSFGYACFMSTFFWEMGLEAYFEQPSIQDTIITPILGTLLGMVFESAIEHIEKNDGKWLGSKTLGGTAMFIMDPVNPILDHSTSAIRFLKSHGARLYLVRKNTDVSTDLMSTLFESSYNGHDLEEYLGLFLEFKF
ncbi:MAG: hypothetical protein A2381_08095 [Bdellovibrionales bacterium RIFOXYB1_FULL_37_110]|nr:MAG: hypothetical protein A2181_04860 [Bdellovibrionales bacterium RIFOXYA1_FULL_38_20]OFZ52564.1 MAG: hypothetical protein A2417_00815 [Bdellovibrionales bacterium RIFOXYC1_FULL_37_79]OFZ59766.1 MAG: hypothetical protein A2381_08095 [Bdellovibrionales bacterium RIFOXYB1_FULL_37_110]OFZ65327.1 MAG: hypothetical protein A2577_04235 [Bdellovibrionales bacterium RIFOXYD1_FULL_36_51]